MVTGDRTERGGGHPGTEARAGDRWGGEAGTVPGAAQGQAREGRGRVQEPGLRCSNRDAEGRAAEDTSSPSPSSTRHGCQLCPQGRDSRGHPWQAAVPSQSWCPGDPQSGIAKWRATGKVEQGCMHVVCVCVHTCGVCMCGMCIHVVCVLHSVRVCMSAVCRCVCL